MENPFELLFEQIRRLEAKVDALTKKMDDRLEDELPDKGGVELPMKMFGWNNKQTVYNMKSKELIPYQIERSRLTFYKSELEDWDQNGRPSNKERKAEQVGKVG